MIRLQVQSRADSGTRYWCFLLANDWETLSKSTGKGFTTKNQQNMISGAIGSRIDKVRLGKSTGDFRTKGTSEDSPITQGKSAFGRPLPAGPSSTSHSVVLSIDRIELQQNDGRGMLFMFLILGDKIYSVQFGMNKVSRDANFDLLFIYSIQEFLWRVRVANFERLDLACSVNRFK